MRVFVALKIPDGVRDGIAKFTEEICGLAPQARWARPEAFHVTIKFIGEQTVGEVETIKQALTKVRHSGFEIVFRGCGFFPTAKSARVFWIGIEVNPALKALAKMVDEELGRLGIPREERDFSPHLTLARAGRSAAPQGSGSQGRVFQKLRKGWQACPPGNLVPWRPAS